MIYTSQYAPVKKRINLFFSFSSSEYPFLIDVRCFLLFLKRKCSFKVYPFH